MLSNTQVILRKMKSMVTIGIGGAVAFGGIGIWTGDEKFFTEVLLPVLNKIDPELSHKAAITLTKYHLNRSPPEINQINLKTTVGGLVLSNPIGLAAGFDKSAECVSGLARLGLGYVEIGSVTPLPQDGNAKPRLFRLPQDQAVINRYGFNNDGHDRVYERIKNFKAKNPSYPIGVNLGANKNSENRIEDYCRGIDRFSEIADYFVINISSPNTPQLRDLQNSESLSILLKEVLNRRKNSSRKVPIFLKVAPDLNEDEIESMISVLSVPSLRVDGLILSNTTTGRENLKSPTTLSTEAGGLSGKPLSELSTRLIEKFYRGLHGKIPIIGVGGVWNGKDAYDKICSGASAVQMYTALTYRGPGIIHKTKEELSTLLKENGFESVEQAVGSKFKK